MKILITTSKKLGFKLPAPRVWKISVWGAFKDWRGCAVGKNLIVLRPEKVESVFPEITSRYPNKKIAIKIADHIESHGLNGEDVIIQNLANMNRIAPRVYECILIKIDDKVYPAQVVEYVDGKHPERTSSRDLWTRDVKSFIERYDIIATNDWFSANFVGDKLVDFGLFKFKDMDAYYTDLLYRFNHTAYWGNNNHDTSYQNIPEIGIVGGRTTDRFELLGINDLDLTGKTVLDIGCSGGQSLYWAVKHGADRVVGIDLIKVARVTEEMANYHGYQNIETVGCDLTKENVQALIFKKTGLKEFDVVFMFSVNQHVGFHQYMRDLCKGTLYLETNAAKMPDVEVKEYPEELRKLGYKKFDYKGQVNEAGGRSLFICE